MAGTRSSARKSSSTAGSSKAKSSGRTSDEYSSAVSSPQKNDDSELVEGPAKLKASDDDMHDKTMTSGTPIDKANALVDSPPTVAKSQKPDAKSKTNGEGCSPDSSLETIIVDDEALEVALQNEASSPANAENGAEEEEVAGDDDWAEEEKKLRAENKRRQEEELKKTKRMSSKEKIQLLDNLLQKAAAYSAFLRGRMQEAVAHNPGAAASETRKTGEVTRDPRQPRLVTGAVMHEMGLGKTLQTIAFIAHLCEQKVFGPFLIVAPLSTIQNWRREFERFAPSIPNVVYHGSKDERKEIRDQILDRKPGQQWPVVITSFEVAMNDAKVLARMPRGGAWKYLVVDEGHRLKNKDCRLLRELKALPTDNRLLLSGTPLQLSRFPRLTDIVGIWEQNNLTELWSLLNFILPQIFTDLSTFQNWFDFEEDLNAGEGAQRIIAEEQANKTISKLHTILDPFLLRRLKSDVELCLPDKREFIVYAPWTPTQVKINLAIAERRLEEHCKSDAAGGFRPGADGSWAGAECVEAVNDKATSLQNVMMQMRKCCNHPYLFQAPRDPAGNLIFDERLVQSGGKLQLLDRILPTLKASGHKVLIFCQMTIMLDLLEDYLELRKYRYERIDGTVPWKERQDRMDSFNGQDDSFVFLLSTRAGGVGINLVAADTVIFYDSDWNPQQDLQAQDRCHRIGQTKPVLVLRMLTIDSIESHIYERACSKRKLELVAIARKRFKVADKVEHGAKIEDLEAAGKDKRGFVAQVRESLSAEELGELLRQRCVAEKCNENVIGDKELETLLTVRDSKRPIPEQGKGWLCVTHRD